MARFQVVTEIAAPPEVCFDLSRSIDLHVESMAGSGERVVGGVRSGLLGLDEEVTWEARHFGLTWRMTSRISELERPHRFVDQGVQGPFSSFRHEHRFEGEASTTMTDVLEWHGGWSLIGAVPAPLVTAYLRHLIIVRNQAIRARAEAAAA